jgi:hypothetical protein
VPEFWSPLPGEGLAVMPWAGRPAGLEPPPFVWPGLPGRKRISLS